ncbi:MAG: DUF192 domain-containing protein [Aliiglaciecola sp.]|uniref:DUF192 domain-containing protein n=1 Tax=Aliiglaciecola sp. M165 TaxID=2593649 RepID=UPI00117F6B8B|nr:DUF192 domain-containing protein [Aliiglaciecola sp. M165]
MQKTLGGFIVLILAMVLIPLQNSYGIEFERAKVQVNDIVLDVEYALTFEQRATGLMYRQSLCTNCGMLFKYSRPRIAGMWMKNTNIPLDVAFIDEHGKIIDIKAMQPHDLTSISSSKEVLYALEMNQGWFKSNGVEVGQIMRFSLPQ